MNEVLVEVDSLWKKYARTKKEMIKYGIRDVISAVVGVRNSKELRKGEFWSLQDVSFQVKRGEVIGLCGHNGAGKTTLLKALSGLLHPDRGSAIIRGRVGWLVDIGAGLNANLSGRENVQLRIDMLGLRTRNQELLRYVEDFSELGEFLDTPVGFYSSGMKAKLGFAIATMITPDVLIVDETLAVGDLAFRMKCYNRISEISKSAAILFVSHGMNHVARICNSGIFMRGGKVVYKGDVQETIRLYHEHMTIGDFSSQDGFNSDLVNITNVESRTEIIEAVSNGQFSISFRHGIEIGELNFNLVIRDLAGAAILECPSPNYDFREEEPSSISVVIPSLDLAPGDYRLSIMVNDIAGNHLAISNSRPIRVSGVHGSETPYKPRGFWSFNTYE